MSLRVAVVGSGPAGFYAAAALLASDLELEVDMIERLPTPWGLVRLGVAPDHPNIKAVSRAFEKTAAQPGFRFFGNVEVGRDVTHADLARLYDAVVYSVGAQTDRQLGIPGEDLPGSWAATEFVAWYNGHPDYQDLELRPLRRARGRDRERQRRARRRAHAGAHAGGARADATRRTRRSRRSTTPASARSSSSAGAGRCRRRGRRSRSASWASSRAPTCSSIRPSSSSTRRAKRSSRRRRRPSRRNVDHLRDYAAREPAGKPRAIRLRFFSSPVAILGDEKVEAIELVRNELVDGRAVATDERETIPCGIVFRSVGYQGVPLPGVPFDEGSRTIPNEGGRVEPGLYAAGWIKRGPSGVIGTNKKDATETVALLLEDARAGLLPPRGEGTLEELLEERGVEAVLYAGWEAIDAAERAAGEPHGRPRIKLATWDDLLAAAKAAAT